MIGCMYNFVCSGEGHGNVGDKVHTSQETNTVYYENHTQINFCEKKAEFLYIKICGIYRTTEL